MNVADFMLVVFGLLPLWGVMILGIAVLLQRFIRRVGLESFGNLTVALAGVVLATMLVVVFVSYTCRIIHPTELFADTPHTEETVSESELYKLEKDVCKLVDRADKFIQAEVGLEGQKDPELVRIRIEEERNATLKAWRTDATILDCRTPNQQPAPIEVPGHLNNNSGDTPIVCYVRNNAKLTQKERVRNTFMSIIYSTNPIERALKKVMECEINSGAYSTKAIEEKISSAVEKFGLSFAYMKEVVQIINTDMLDVIDQRTKEIRAGKLSDCQKALAADAAIDATITDSATRA